MSARAMGVVAVVLVAGMAVACGGGSKPAAEVKASPAAATATMTVASGDFGVPECDNFMKKYIACIDSKVPEMVRPSLKQAFDQQKDAWQKAAATPEGKAALATGCTQAEAAAKQSTAAYGCEW